MYARSISLHNLGETRIQRLIVPFFQRKYIWEEENWKELFDDFANGEETPFLGSIILKELPMVSGVSEMHIIDGQQRLTTVSLLAKAIYDSLPEETKKSSDCGIRTDIRGILFYRENAADNFKDSHIKIEHSRVDREGYNRVIRAEMLDEDKVDLKEINEESSNLLQCYKYFRGRLAGKTEKELTDLYNHIFDEKRKVLVLITLSQGDINEQKIFDTINRAGIRLSVADIIKNHLFKTCLDKAGLDEKRQREVIHVYEDIWEEQFTKRQEDIQIWEQKCLLDKIERNNQEFLLYCVACIKWPKEEKILLNLEAVYEKHIRPYGYKELLDLIKDICVYAEIFRRFVLEFHEKLEEEDIFFKHKDPVTRLFLVLDRFEIPWFYSYILMRLKEAERDIYDESLVKDFGILESFLVRRRLSAKKNTDYQKKCRQILTEGAEVLVKEELTQARLCDRALFSYLSSVPDDTARVILFCIELYRCQDEKKDINSLEYRYTVEHIMPQKWETHWTEVPIMKDGKKLEAKSAEGIKFRNQWIQALGNKTLLTHRLNSALQNVNFPEKIGEPTEDKPGYRSHTALHITRELVEQFDAGDKVWDERHIIERTWKIYHDILEIWPSFQELLLGDEPNKEDMVDDLTEAEPELERFSPEQLADPIELLKAVKES